MVPDWLKQIIRKGPNAGNLFTVTHPAKGTKTKKARPGSPITRKVRFVCKPCNTGWLSNLEEELKPILKALIQGDAVTLDHWKQRRLATWAVKTTMIAEFMHPETAAIRFDIREHLRLHREPHRDFNVWASFYRGEGMLLGFEHYSGEFLVLDPATKPIERPNTQTTVIGLGHLFLQVSYCGASGFRFNYKDQTAQYLRCIWPPQDGDIIWPPPFHINAQGLGLIMNGIYRSYKTRLIDF